MELILLSETMNERCTRINRLDGSFSSKAFKLVRESNGLSLSWQIDLYIIFQTFNIKNFVKGDSHQLIFDL